MLEKILKYLNRKSIVNLGGEPLSIHRVHFLVAGHALNLRENLKNTTSDAENLIQGTEILVIDFVF